MIQQKCVSFDLSQSKAHESPLFQDEAKKLWYNSNEIKKLRSQTLKLIETDDRAFSYESVIRGTFQACCNAAEKGSNTTVLTRVQHDVLKRWIASYPDLLGMDKYVTSGRTERNREHCQAVLEVQDMHFKHDHELLRFESQDSSRASRLYARTIAQAQADIDLDEAESARVDHTNKIAARSVNLPKLKQVLSRPLPSFAKNPRGGTAA
jgi:hypothetical protein